MHMVKSDVRYIEGAKWCDSMTGDLSSLTLEIESDPPVDVSIHSRRPVINCSVAQTLGCDNLWSELKTVCLNCSGM